MAHFKRGKAKSARAGCQLCKPHKSNAFKDTASARTPQEQQSLDRMKEGISSLQDEDDEGFNNP